MNKVNLYGASGHSKVIIEILETNKDQIINVFDDNSLIKDVIGYNCKDASKIEFDNSEWIVSIGNNAIRKVIVEKYNKMSFTNAIHKSANISKRAVIGVGTVIMCGVSINSEVNIGSHCIINTNASIDHECVLSNFVHISPNATLTGNIKVGEGTMVGAGVTIIPNINIGKWCVIGAGSVVINDIPDYSVVVGNPAKIIKTNNI